MKQGTGKSSYDHGTKGVAQTVSVKAVAGMGMNEGAPPLYTGSKGGQAPACSCTSHPSGSQGKH